MAGDMSENQKENIKLNLRKKKEYILTSKSFECIRYNHFLVSFNLFRIRFMTQIVVTEH